VLFDPGRRSGWLGADEQRRRGGAEEEQSDQKHVLKKGNMAGYNRTIDYNSHAVSMNF
jgi:hypothetical protein